MKIARKPENEEARLIALESYEVLDTHEEEAYDQLTYLASAICGTKISLISLVDRERQWFKAHHGITARETPRDVAFCSHVVADDDVLIVEDARLDQRFHDNPLVTGDTKIIFYAGVPLKDPDGHVLGSMCVIDDQPKALNNEQIESLKILSRQVIDQLRLRREIKQRRDFFDQMKRLTAQVPGVIYQFSRFDDGRVSFPYATDSISEIYEVSPQEVSNDARKVFSRIHSEDLDLVKDSIDSSALTLQNWSCDYRVILPTKGMRWLRGFAKPERVFNGVIWYGFITDITEIKKMEEALVQNSKMVAMGEMAGGIAHEINNPLAIIKGKAVVIKKIVKDPSFPEKEKCLEYLSDIEKTTDRIVKIIRGLKAFSRNAEADPFCVVSVDSIVEDTITMVQEKFKNNEIHFDVPFHLV